MKIKQCLFCKNNKEGKIYVISENEDGNSLGCYYVECGSCDACGPICMTEEQAIGR